MQPNTQIASDAASSCAPGVPFYWDKYNIGLDQTQPPFENDPPFKDARDECQVSTERKQNHKKHLYT